MATPAASAANESNVIGISAGLALPPTIDMDGMASCMPSISAGSEFLALVLASFQNEAKAVEYIGPAGFTHRRPSLCEVARAPSSLTEQQAACARYRANAWSVLMCDYSLHNVYSRPAKAGDVLVTAEFAGADTRGFSPIGEPETAVCLLPGTELAFGEDAACDHPFAALYPAMRFGDIGARLARFRQIERRSTAGHRDALEFANGKVVLLTRLRPGQRATVLQLPAQRRVERDENCDDRGSSHQLPTFGRGRGPALA